MDFASIVFFTTTTRHLAERLEERVGAQALTYKAEGRTRQVNVTLGRNIYPLVRDRALFIGMAYCTSGPAAPTLEFAGCSFLIKMHALALDA